MTFPMRSEPDPLEEELRSLRPQDPSPRFVPQFRRNVARRSWRNTLVAAACLTGTAAAASLATVFIMHRGTPLPPPENHYSAPQTSEPTLAEYRRAVNQSPQALDTLLRQPPSNRPPEPSSRLSDLQKIQWN
jgi:hypothetical protein